MIPASRKTPVRAMLGDNEKPWLTDWRLGKLLAGLLLLTALAALFVLLSQPKVEPVFRLVVNGENQDLARLLRENPAQIRKILYGRTPLHYAAISRNQKALNLLLKTGAEIEAPDSDGNTPLHLAVFSLSTASVLRLLEAGARSDAENHYGHTPLLVAAYLGMKGPALDALIINTPTDKLSEWAHHDLFEVAGRRNQALYNKLRRFR